jgi:hypothetical protein
MPPNNEMSTPSTRTIRRMRRRDMPTARSRPSSRVRSTTDRARVLAMPRPATSTANNNNTLTIPRMMSTELVRSSTNAGVALADELGTPATTAASRPATAVGEAPASVVTNTSRVTGSTPTSPARAASGASESS